VFFMLFPVCQKQENADREEDPLLAVPAIIAVKRAKPSLSNFADEINWLAMRPW
jgi:hypothetical protein